MLLRDFTVTEDTPGVWAVHYNDGEHQEYCVVLEPIIRHPSKRAIVMASIFGEDLRACEYAVMKETLREIVRRGCDCAKCTAKNALEELELGE